MCRFAAAIAGRPAGQRANRIGTLWVTSRSTGLRGAVSHAAGQHDTRAGRPDRNDHAVRARPVPSTGHRALVERSDVTAGQRAKRDAFEAQRLVIRTQLHVARIAIEPRKRALPRAYLIRTPVRSHGGRARARGAIGRGGERWVSHATVGNALLSDRAFCARRTRCATHGPEIAGRVGIADGSLRIPISTYTRERREYLTLAFHVPSVGRRGRFWRANWPTSSECWSCMTSNWQRCRSTVIWRLGIGCSAS